MQTQAQSQAGTGETHMGNWEWVDLEQANEKLVGAARSMSGRGCCTESTIIDGDLDLCATDGSKHLRRPCACMRCSCNGLDPSVDQIKLTPCLDHLKIPSFFTLSPSHQFLAACMEY
jgi:hypothetical protein